MDLAQYARAIKKSWWLVLAASMGGLLIALLALATTTPTYRSSATLFASVGQTSSATDLNQGTTFTQQVVKSYATVATSDIVTQPVVQRLNLTESPTELATKISASAPVDTVTLVISVEDHSPRTAALIANEVAKVLAATVEQLVPATTGGTSPAVKLTTIQPAVPSTAPVMPSKTIYLILGLLLGVTGGVLSAALRSVLDNRVRTPDDASDVGETPVAGSVPWDPQAGAQPLANFADSADRRVESYRSARVGLEFLGVGGRRKAIVITSAVPGEGKSTTAANAALAFAESGLRVLLVDGDLRRPRLANYFGLVGEIGLSDVLIGSVDAADAMQAGAAERLTVLPAGTVPPNPSELLESSALRDAISLWSDQYDLVIIDAPPILAVADAVILARWTRAAILVAGANKLRKAQLREACARLARAKPKVSGIILNRVRGTQLETYGYSYAQPSQGAGSSRVAQSRKAYARNFPAADPSSK